MPLVVRLVDHRKMGDRAGCCGHGVIQTRPAQIDVVEGDNISDVQTGHGLQVGLDVRQVVHTVPVLQQIGL